VKGENKGVAQVPNAICVAFLIQGRIPSKTRRKKMFNLMKFKLAVLIVLKGLCSARRNLYILKVVFCYNVYTSLFLSNDFICISTVFISTFILFDDDLLISNQTYVKSVCSSSLLKEIFLS